MSDGKDDHEGKRERAHSGANAKSAIMVAALGVTSVFDFLERQEQGQHPLAAAKDAYEGLKHKAKVLGRVAKELGRKPEKGWTCESCEDPSGDARSAEFQSGKPAWECLRCGHLTARTSATGGKR